MVSTDPQHLPLGVGSWLIKLLGLLITVLALSLGAPFWFDALTKLGSLRQAGPKRLSRCAPPDGRAAAGRNGVDRRRQAG